MPTLRVLADGTWTYATPGQPAPNGVPMFQAGSADRVLCAIDYTAWLGSATITTSTWAINGAQLIGPATDGATVSVLVQLPETTATAGIYYYPTLPPVLVSNVIEASDGRVLNVPLYIGVKPKPGAMAGETVILDGSVLG